VEELFYCGYAPYFWQAVKIRYLEYCGAAKREPITEEKRW